MLMLLSVHVRVIIFSTGGKFRPVSILHTLTLVARSCALLAKVILVYNENLNSLRTLAE